MYPKSIYKDGSSLVMWSPEEHAARKADGWSDDKPASAADVHLVGLPEESRMLAAAATQTLDQQSLIGELAAPAEAPIAAASDTASTPGTTDGEAPPVPVVEQRPVLLLNALPEKVARAVKSAKKA